MMDTCQGISQEFGTKPGEADAKAIDNITVITVITRLYNF